ncbi:MAG: putative Ig domain-containing protein [Pirellulales bacterium]|nr:putative Ig domain-containing protein [Pirellulales bacterium]
MHRDLTTRLFGNRIVASPSRGVCTQFRLELLESRLVFAAPTLGALADVSLLSGAPLHIALNGFDSDGDALTYTVTTDNSDLIGIIPTGNQSLKITTVREDAQGNVVQTFGDMVFQLFDDKAPRTTGHIKQLVNQGFYNGVVFHRIIRNFVIQGGDPTGTGSGGSSLGRIDDEYDRDLQFTSAGVLAMAKSSDDTNDSQFFITAGPTRSLDFQHSIFGFLTQGADVREAIAATPTGAGDRPADDIVMQSVSLFTDTQNGVLRLSAANGKSGTAHVTVKVRDAQGNEATQSFTVTISPDTVNNNPFLKAVSTIQTTQGAPVIYEFEAIDVEGDPIQFQASQVTTGVNITVPGGTVNVTPTGGVAKLAVMISPDAALVGNKQFRLFVRPVGSTATSDQIVDAQLVQLAIAPLAPSGVALDSSVDTGVSAIDAITKENTNLVFKVAGVLQGATVQLRLNGQVIGQATAAAAASGQNPGQVVLTVPLNDGLTLTPGQHAITAVQIFDGLTSAVSPALPLVIDQQTPAITSTPSTTPLLAGSPTPFYYNVETDEETAGVVYSLIEAPSGMTVNNATGEIQWSPTSAQVGQHSVVVRAVDRAGNASDQPFDVTVAPNTPPILSQPDALSGDEGILMVLPLHADDVDLAIGDVLTYSLLPGAPDGAMMTPFSGVFSWRPSEVQGPGTYSIGVRVTDSAGNSDTKNLQVTVAEVNQPPQLAPIGAQVVAAGGKLGFRATAVDADFPAGSLVYSLLDGAPVGMSVDPQTGQVTWSVPDGQAAGDYLATIVVTDQGQLTDSRQFTVRVQTRPIIEPLANQSVVEEETLEVQVVASSAAVPTSALSYALVNAPQGASIDAKTGKLTWTPSEAQGPGRYNIEAAVTDSNGLSSHVAFDVDVAERNTVPRLVDIGPVIAIPGQLLSIQFEAVDADLPSNSFTFSIVEGPQGAVIHPMTGVFRWLAPDNDSFKSVPATVRVADSGTPNLFAELTFSITLGNPGIGIFPGSGPGLPWFVSPSAANASAALLSLVASGTTSVVVLNGAEFRAFNQQPFDVDVVETPDSELAPIIRPATQFQIGPDTGVGSFDTQAPRQHRVERPTTTTGGADAATDTNAPDSANQSPQKGAERGGPIDDQAAADEQLRRLFDDLALPLADLVFERLTQVEPVELLLYTTAQPAANLTELAPPAEQAPAASDIDMAAGYKSDNGSHTASKVAASAALAFYMPLLVTELSDEADEPIRERTRRSKRAPAR